jgi:hypothetical protein
VRRIRRILVYSGVVDGLRHGLSDGLSDGLGGGLGDCSSEGDSRCA